MPVNHYFQNFNPAKMNEQRLFEDLITESIQIMGHDVYYLPREQWDQTDKIFGENVNAKFENAFKLDMYILNVDGFQGDGEFFSKFGLEIRDNSNFVVARRTFIKHIPTSLAMRPREGDLIYVPLMNKIFEITFVEEKVLFYTGGNRTPYMFELRCETFRYSNEAIDTGIPEIDVIEDNASYTIEVSVSGSGNYEIGETVYQGTDFANATMSGTISNWDPSNNKMYLINVNGSVQSGNNLIGVSSNTQNYVVTIDTMGDHVYYDNFDNKLIQDEANNYIVIDRNPFGSP